MVWNLRAILAFVLVISTFNLFSQDLTGVWRGHFKSGNYSRLMDSLGIEDRYKFETQLAQKGNNFEGVTYSYKTTVFYGKASCMGTISAKTKKVIIGENNLLEVKSSDGGACLMTCFLQYSKVGDEEFLEGSYTSISVRDSTQCGGGTVFLRKVPNSDFYKEPFLVEAEKAKAAAPPVARNNPPATPKKDAGTKITPAPNENKPAPPPAKKTATAAPKKTAPPKPKAPAIKKEAPLVKKNDLKTTTDDSFRTETPKVSAPIPIPRVLATRQNELVKTITSSAKEITVRIYDNGTIDNDTVSVYLDNKLVVSRQRLTDQPISVKVNLDDDQEYHELVMVAENLGEIPPNTSLMVVNAGGQQYEVRITSTEQKNAAVRFKRER